jgi:hypothetical protein
MPSSIANWLMDRLWGGIIFFNTASFRSGEYRMHEPPAPLYNGFQFMRHTFDTYFQSSQMNLICNEVRALKQINILILQQIIKC